jgi:hypothetical protein
VTVLGRRAVACGNRKRSGGFEVSSQGRYSSVQSQHLNAKAQRTRRAQRKENREI